MSLFKSVTSLFQWVPGFALQDGGLLQQMSDRLFSATGASPLTALAGGGLSALTPLLSKGYNRISVCATNADSVVLPLAIPGTAVYVDNDGAADARVYAQTDNPDNADAADLIVAYNGLTGAAAAYQSQATVKSALYVCTTLGYWKQSLFA